MDDGTYLVDETGGAVSMSIPQSGGMRTMTSRAVASAIDRQGNAIADLIEQIQERQFEHSMVMAFGMDLPTPDDDGGDVGGTNSFNTSFAPLDYGTNLWIAQPTVTNAWLTGIGTNTIADVQYEIQSRSNLAQFDWQSEGFFLGSEATNWTPLGVAQNGRTNLFIRLRSWADTDNVGIPDWWQLQYFGYVGIDPYGNPEGDGFNNIYKYQNGLDPNAFASPPAPGNFVAVQSTTGTNVLLRWSAAQGAVTGYTIVRGSFNDATSEYDYTTVAVASSTTNSYLYLGAIQTSDDLNDFYSLTADYPSSGSSDTIYADIYPMDYVPPAPPTPVYNIAVLAKLIRNSTGRWQLMFSGLPANAQSINLIWLDTNRVSSTQNISTNLVVGGVYQFADTNAVSHLGNILSVQGMDANGESGQASQAGTLANDAPYFVDGREHMKQNLSFLIRAAGTTLPYKGESWSGGLLAGNYNQAATGFEEFSFLHHGSWGTTSAFNRWTGGVDVDNSYSVLDNLWPFAANYELDNFFLDTSTYTNLSTVFDDGYGGNQPFQFRFQPDFTTNIPAPPILNHANPYWIIQPQFAGNYVDYPPALLGLTLTTDSYGSIHFNDSVSLQSGVYNLFGLPYERACLIKETGDHLISNLPAFADLAAGGAVSLSLSEQTNDWFWEGYASQCPAPTLVFDSYFFAPLLNPKSDSMDIPGSTPDTYYFGNDIQYPTPIDDTFSVTNQTPPVIIAVVGQPVIVGSWAKYLIQGSSPAKYAYLGEYFATNAFMLDASGNLTTNSAGVVSPYGEFFPTQGGAARFVTMPDSGQQGTCTVQVVSLSVDANHDGVMDSSYFGQDQTSPDKPYVFWCNNNFDRIHKVDGSDIEQDDLTRWAVSPLLNDPYNLDPGDDDAHYQIGGTRVIPCIRDLEDFSRLSIDGVTSNLLASLPVGSTVTLNWGDVGSPSPSNPTIDLFQAADTDGGIGYLTNNTVATLQTNYNQCWYLGPLAPGGSIQLNAIQFNNFWAGNHFIWCGVTNGSGRLNLTFANAQGSVFGQASVYIQIKDIKQMYERWSVGDNGNNPPLAYAINVDDGTGAVFQYGPAATNTPYILHVHGWNMFSWEKDRFAETEYKRLYWQGYQGRFGEFRWPTFAGFPLNEFSSQGINPRNFDNSEYNAWLSGTGLLNILTDLNAEYPGNVYLTAHSMGNVVAGEALRLAGNTQVVNTYIAMQAAVSAHAYDPNTVARSSSFSTPDNYASYPTTSASYFNGSAGAGTYINFFNTNDFALHSGTFSWDFNQNNKPDHGIVGFSIPYPGYCYSVTSQHPNGYFALLGAGSSSYQNFNFPADTYTIFAYCDQARSYALGAQIGVGGVFITGSETDLQSVWPPDTHPVGGYKEHVWHSAEFRSDYASRMTFWNEVLGAKGFNLK
ncbi:MAG TPA: hypothetical protein VG347_09585 [Verrucomicrobiae bacterium]|nr:hypothetical protein [Verrucomicrobiae bacterium]